MPDKKLTDSEIVKALSNMTYGGHYCAKCKYDNGKGEDRCGLKGCKIARYALDLINRQKAEIERLENEAFIYKIRWAKSEVRETKAKVKAVKEVFQKLKDKSIMCKVKLYGKGKFFPCLSAVTLHDIRLLEKELVGE